MGLTKYKLGQLIKQSDVRNTDGLFLVDSVRGISTGKEFIDTKANMNGVSLTSYKIVNGGQFAYVADTSRRGDKIAIAYNNCDDTILISSIYTVFYISKKELLLPEYLFMYFNRPEFDRYSRYNSWGSARETFTWDDMCDIDLELPSIDVQQKYIDIYNGLIENQKSYEHGLDDLKLTCDAYIENLRRENSCETIGKHLTIRNEQNSNLQFKDKDVLGVSQDKQIIPTKSDTKGNDISKFIVIYPNDFIYNPRNGIAIGLNKINAIISWNNTAFYINDDAILPQYLMLWFSRKEWNRKVKIDSWGSSTEVYSFDSLCSTQIPIPDINIQKSISDIYDVYTERRKINENLKNQIKDICPILIKGSLEEGRKEA